MKNEYLPLIAIKPSQTTCKTFTVKVLVNVEIETPEAN